MCRWHCIVAQTLSFLSFDGPLDLILDRCWVDGDPAISYQVSSPVLSLQVATITCIARLETPSPVRSLPPAASTSGRKIVFDPFEQIGQAFSLSFFQRSFILDLECMSRKQRPEFLKNATYDGH